MAGIKEISGSPRYVFKDSSGIRPVTVIDIHKVVKPDNPNLVPVGEAKAHAQRKSKKNPKRS